jgi:outer membrane protein assembly factor BamA
MQVIFLREIINKKIFAGAVLLMLLLCMQLVAFAQKLTHTDSARLHIDTVKQKDLIDIAKKEFKIKINKPRADNDRRLYFTLFPATSNLPGGKVLVTSTTAGFYLGNKNNTSLSGVSFSPYLNFKGRYAVSFRSNIWTNKNLWNMQGDLRFSLYPQYTWGLGTQHSEDDKLLVNYKYIRFYESVLRRIRPYFLAGVGYYLDYHINITTINDTGGLQKFAGYNYGTAAGSNSFSGGLTLNLLYDSRNNNNPINPLPGAYANLVYRFNPRFFGNKDSWNSLYLDLRKYISLDKKTHHVLAFWTYMWTALDSGVPYLDLPSIGWDSYQHSGRGIDQNRYRGKTLLDFEMEYRRDITQNGLFGFVVFANANTVTEPGSHKLSTLHPAVGTGLRIKLNKHSNTNVSFDFGVSSDNTSYIISLGEAF